MVSVRTPTLPLEHKTATDNTEMNRSSCIPKKFHLQKQMSVILTPVCQPLLYIQEIHSVQEKTNSGLKTQ